MGRTYERTEGGSKLSFWERIGRSTRTRARTPTNSFSLSELNSFFTGGGKASEIVGSDLSEIVYFVCLKVLCESMGKLSIHLKDSDNNKITDHEAYSVFRVQPNVMMTPSTFKMMMEFNRNHYGNAYAYIKHDARGQLEGIYPLDPRQVMIWIGDGEFFKRQFYYYYTDARSGKSYWINPEDMIHLKGGISRDGLAGMCVREVLARNMHGNKAAQKFLNNLYEQGLTANAVIKYTGDLDQAKKAELIKELSKFTADSSDRIIPLPLGMDIVPLNLKLTDSQFFELKKFSSLQIAAAFGVKPNHINDYEKSSYANSEMQNLSFYIDTLLINLTGWEEELNRKLLTSKEQKTGYGFKFNVSTILRGDLKSQAEALSKYVTSGIYTPNQARRYLGEPAEDGGDVLLVNGSYVKIEEVGKAYAQKNGGESV